MRPILPFVVVAAVLTLPAPTSAGAFVLALDGAGGGTGAAGSATLAVAFLSDSTCGTLDILVAGEPAASASRDVCVQLTGFPLGFCGHVGNLVANVTGSGVALSGTFLGVATGASPICMGQPASIAGTVGLGGTVVDGAGRTWDVRLQGSIAGGGA